MVPLVHQNGISIGSAVFAWLTNVANGETHRQTDHATLSIPVGRICAVHAMRHKADYMTLNRLHSFGGVFNPIANNLIWHTYV